MKKTKLMKVMKTMIPMALFCMLTVSSTNLAHAGYDDDLYILEHLICGEAEGCSKEMKMAVGSVVLNRVADDRFPDSIADVVFQSGQYACTWDGNYYREPSDETHEVALYLLENGTQLDESVVWQAEFVQGNGVYEQIGNMYFCY